MMWCATTSPTATAARAHGLSVAVLDHARCAGLCDGVLADGLVGLALHSTGGARYLAMAHGGHRRAPRPGAAR